jgi:GNAT superfamily N-acetyltransferase
LSSAPEVIQIALPIAGIDELQAEARAEGIDFIDTLVAQWASGEVRFDAPGEILCGCLDAGRLIAIGGLNLDPFASRPDTGRIRRIYVLRAWRNHGLGRLLVAHLVDVARLRFHYVRLRAINQDAARLYERLGFRPLDDPNSTHILDLTETHR